MLRVEDPTGKFLVLDRAINVKEENLRNVKFLGLGILHSVLGALGRVMVGREVNKNTECTCSKPQKRGSRIVNPN